MNKVVKLLAVSAVFFYALCWFANSQDDVIWGIGISLPWLSLILCIPLILFTEKDEAAKYWTYMYIVLAVAYAVVVSIMQKSVWQVVPHLAACVSFIAYVYIDSSNKRNPEVE